MLPKPEAIDAKPEIPTKVKGAFDMRTFADEPRLKAMYHACISKSVTDAIGQGQSSHAHRYRNASELGGNAQARDAVSRCVMLRKETFMKSVLSLGVILTMSILLGSVPNLAKAVPASHAGTICRAGTSTQQASLVNEPYGVVNTSTTSSASVVCPLVRTSTGSSISVYVDGYLLADGQAITCVLFSFDYSGNILGSHYFSSPQGGTFDIYASVPSANVWSTATVECTLPPAELAYANYPTIYDIDVVE